MENIVIQPFEHKHLADVAYIHSQVADGWGENGLAGDIDNRNNHSYVALAGDRAVAFCSFLVVDDDCRNIQPLFKTAFTQTSHTS